MRINERTTFRQRTLSDKHQLKISYENPTIAYEITTISIEIPRIIILTKVIKGREAHAGGSVLCWLSWSSVVFLQGENTRRKLKGVFLTELGLLQAHCYSR